MFLHRVVVFIFFTRRRKQIMSHVWSQQAFSLWRRRGYGVLRLFLMALVVSFVYLGPVVAVESGSPTEAIKKTIDQVLVILGDEQFKKPGRSEDRIVALKKIIGERFDYEEMGKRTLGLEWKKLDRAQQNEFVALFQKFLLNTYAGNVDSYSGEKVEYIKERRKGEFAEVQTKVISKKLEIPIAYRLLKKSNNWWIYDFVIDGISLVKNFRGQFNRIMKAKGFSGLLDKLRIKIEKKSKAVSK